MLKKIFFLPFVLQPKPPQWAHFKVTSPSEAQFIFLLVIWHPILLMRKRAGTLAFLPYKDSELFTLTSIFLWGAQVDNIKLFAVLPACPIESRIHYTR